MKPSKLNPIVYELKKKKGIMTVKTLSNILHQIDPNAKIVLAYDPEGNAFSFLKQVDYDGDTITFWPDKTGDADNEILGK